MKFPTDLTTALNSINDPDPDKGASALLALVLRANAYEELIGMLQHLDNNHRSGNPLAFNLALADVRRALAKLTAPRVMRVFRGGE